MWETFDPSPRPRRGRWCLELNYNAPHGTPASYLYGPMVLCVHPLQYTFGLARIFELIGGAQGATPLLFLRVSMYLS